MIVLYSSRGVEDFKEMRDILDGGDSSSGDSESDDENVLSMD
jgi:hypothetical protein